MQAKIDHIPLTTPCNRRPGVNMQPTTITIHNTGNPDSSAAGERAWLTNPSNGRTASYHYVVDDCEIVECIPVSEHAWHAGDGHGDGNMRSIGIELCECGDFSKTMQNAAQFVAALLRERGWGVDRLRRHYDWSGKICPRLMYDGGTWAGWAAFKDMVAGELAAGEEKPMTSEEKTELEALRKRVAELEEQQRLPEIPEWALDACVAAKRAGIVDTTANGSYDFYRTVTMLHRAKVFQ